MPNHDNSIFRPDEFHRAMNEMIQTGTCTFVEYIFSCNNPININVAVTNKNPWPKIHG